MPKSRNSEASSEIRFHLQKERSENSLDIVNYFIIILRMHDFDSDTPAVFLRFYEELNDFLPPKWRKVEFAYPLAGHPSIKDVVEAVGVPHPEIDLILANHVSVPFSYRVQPDDHISVYPMFEAFDIRPVTRLRPHPLREPKFVADVHLGKLAIYLRFAGFDTAYRRYCDDAELARISADERRILLTRDRELLKRRIVTHGYYLRSTNPKIQIQEIISRFQLTIPTPLAPQRCTRCNARLETVEKAAILNRLPAGIQREYDEFFRCPRCDKMYWRGSHFQRLSQMLHDACAPMS